MTAAPKAARTCSFAPAWARPEPVMLRRAVILSLLASLTLSAGPALAQVAERRGEPVSASTQDPAPPPADRIELEARGESYLQLFRRALLPGPNGALVETQEAAPLHQYLGLQARDIDTPWRKDSV